MTRVTSEPTIPPVIVEEDLHQTLSLTGHLPRVRPDHPRLGPFCFVYKTIQLETRQFITLSRVFKRSPDIVNNMEVRCCV